jgi:hypothetical protein
MGQTMDVISRYEALFAVRTGLTILMQKSAALDGGLEVPVRFQVSAENPRDVVITGAEGSAVLKELRKDHLDAAIQRGVIMLYEMNGDEVVRCTPCYY